MSICKLTIKSKPAINSQVNGSDPASADIFNRSSAPFGGGVELLLNDQPMRMVQKLCLFIDAATLVPSVALVMTPDQLDIQLDEAELHKFLGHDKGLLYDLAGNAHVSQSPPPVPLQTLNLSEEDAKAFQQIYAAAFFTPPEEKPEQP